jgi:hypothetical protein
MADQYLAMDVATVTRHVEALFTAFPDLADDEALRADMIEGETDLHRVVSRALSHKLEARAMLKGMELVKADLVERNARWQRRDDAMGVLIKGLLEVSGLEKLTLPEATISINQARASVDVTDIDALPQGYFTTERKADKTAIGNELKAGREVPGAALVYGEPSLTVRTK